LANIINARREVEMHSIIFFTISIKLVVFPLSKAQQIVK